MEREKTAILENQAFDKNMNDMNKRLEELYHQSDKKWQAIDKIQQKMWNAEEGTEKWTRLNN